MSQSKLLIVGTRFSSSNSNPQGLSESSVVLLSHLRALDMWNDNGLTASGDAFVDSQPYNDELWAKVDELHAHFGLDLNG